MDDPRPFFKNMLKSTFKTKVGNPEEISSPVVEAIRENTEAVKDKDVAKQMSKPIVTALVDVMEKMDERKEHDDSKLDKLFSNIQQLKIDKILDEIESVKGEKGDDGHTPTKEELIPIIEPLIKPLIPKPIPGKDGDNYILTSKDKKEIANSIKVPVVEKVIETIIEKQPIVTNEIKEVAVAEEAPKIKEKLESLEGDDRLDAKAIKGLPKSVFGGGGGIKRIDAANDTRIISPTNGQTLVWNSTRQVWENSSAGGGSGTVDTIVAGNNIDVDATDPLNPIISVEALTLADITGSTAWRVFYADASGVITQLALGADGTFLKSNGASSAPTFAVPAGSGDVSKVGTPVNNQVGVWTGDGTLEGDADLTFDGTVLSSVGLLLSGLTASELVITDGSKNLVSAAVATYPSLTELTYVKGVTSAIQTQLNSKQTFSWTEVTGTSQSAAVNSGYIANNAGLVTITIPTTASVGDVVEVSGKGAGGWKIAQNASEIIHFGNLDTTTGTGGSLASTHRRDSVRLVCVVADTEWNVIGSVGNITVV